MSREKSGGKYYILDRIIREVEGSTDNWREGADKNKSFKVQQADYDKLGRSDFVKEAKELENRGLIRIKWISINYEIERICYKLKDMDRIYETVGQEPKWRRQKAARECVEEYFGQSPSWWLGDYYRELLSEIERRKYPSDLKEYGTLLFSHGFFSPLEREFLIRLEAVLKVLRAEGADIAYYHTGDLDYGGVRIFSYIRTNIFPELRPWQMDVGWYERYEEYAVDMEATSREKLRDVKEPLLQPLIERIVTEGKVIEQECFLF